MTRDKLPDHINDAFAKQYSQLTRMEVVQAMNESIDGVKKRRDFTTKVVGIDSNTISSGEDNISIILTALNCLRNITESVAEGQERQVESVLLIDEFDATLHPSAQKRLFDLILEYADKYRIQVFFTTHSLYILKYAYELKQRIVYLVDQLDSVSVMPDPSPSQIEMHLSGLQRTALYQNVFIPVYTEDPEARLFLEQLLDYISKTMDPAFAAARNLLHLVDASIGADALRSLFEDKKANLSTMRAICILDGDQKGEMRDHIIALPGGEAPDRMFSNFLRKLIENDQARAFWYEVQEYGYSKATAVDILKEFDEIADTIAATKALKGSAKGVQRELSKTHFNAHREFYDLVMKAWLNSEDNQAAIKKFRSDLYSVFMKTAALYSIDKQIWPKAAAEAAA